ncbi:glycoside hydrolase family 127 protein, partial [Parabacteroides sp. OttesenSCG-928-B22]|nr:glycoside hydrolase family 127 protein [Parabacteroides sp. OttesenSCG-928-B22]
MAVFLFVACHAGQQVERKPESFPLSHVHLLDGPFKHACDLNVDVLLQYDVDRLLAPFLKEAGLTPKAESFPNWIDLDGHVGGHYLSAMAIHYAATGNRECKERMEYMLAELKKCQDAHGNGYLGGQPDALDRIYNRIKAGNGKAAADAWAPWYNLHKMFAGLRDAWIYGENKQARDMFHQLCDWGLTIISPLDDTQMEQMLDTEFGGMNEVYADAYKVFGEEKYLVAAKRFSHRKLFDSLAKGIDDLDNKHANTQVPKATGYQRVAELSGDTAFTKAATFFWETVVNNRSLAFGGNSRREHFPTADACYEYTEERQGPESCNTYNMLRLTNGLFHMDPQAKYADYYERAMYNHILSTQHPEHGGYVYFTSARPRHYRVYSAPNQAMWCCVGTGMENHGKYGEFIYSHAGNDIFVNLFVASELDWKEKGLKLKQQTAFPYDEKSTLTLSLSQPEQFALLIRYPVWAKNFTVKINGSTHRVKATPSSYV